MQNHYTIILIILQILLENPSKRICAKQIFAELPSDKPMTLRTLQRHLQYIVKAGLLIQDKSNPRGYCLSKQIKGLLKNTTNSLGVPVDYKIEAGNVILMPRLESEEVFTVSIDSFDAAKGFFKCESFDELAKHRGSCCLFNDNFFVVSEYEFYITNFYSFCYVLPFQLIRDLFNNNPQKK